VSMDVGLHYFPIEGKALTGEMLLDIYEAHCKRHKASPNGNIEDMLARLNSKTPQDQTEYTNNFSPWQKFYLGMTGEFLFVRGINHALTVKEHRAADLSLAADVQFILGGAQ